MSNSDGVTVTITKSDGVRIHDEKKSNGVRVVHEKKSAGVRVNHEKKSDGVGWRKKDEKKDERKKAMG